MDKRVKFSLKEKISAVRSIMSGRESASSAARKLGCGRWTIRDWVSLFKQHGVDGLSLRNGSYEGRFKVKVIDYMLKNELSLMQTAAFFGIPNTSVVHRWRRTYERLGALGLLKETRGTKKTMMPRKQKSTKKEASNTDASAKKLAALQKEVEYLRAENAFLKKLDALIQQEEAAKVQSRRQKPSRN